MAQYSFIIPADSISTGDPADPVEVCVDRNLRRKVKQDMLIAKFGEGYEQRVANGINNKQDNFSITLKNRHAEDINRVAAFLDAYTGKGFNFTVTDHDGDTEIRVVCENYDVIYLHENFHTLTAEFRRVYEP